MKVKISVIIPVYNSESYLKRCLDSVINQTFTNLEIIIINDGSTDSSGEILDEFATKDSRIILIHKENGGIGSAYNVALKQVTGVYILFLDSDDYFELNTCEKLIEMAICENADMVHFASKVVDVFGKEIAVNSFGGIDAVAETQDQILDFFVNKLKHPSLINLFKTNLFDDVKILNQNIGIDEMLTPQLLLKMNKAVYTTQSFCNVVAREDSVSRSVYGERKMEQLIEVYNFIIDYVGPKSVKLEKYYTNKYWTLLLATTREHWKQNQKLSKSFLKTVYSEYSILFKKIKHTPYYSNLSRVRKFEVLFYKFMTSRH
jgi:glycosyltransferase involved in cell wall biosynthesis